MKDGIGFHLFITTSPCGDARIFSLHESSTATNPEATKAKIDTIEESTTVVVATNKVSDDAETKEASSETEKPGQDQPEVPEKVITKEPELVQAEEVVQDLNNVNELENYGNDVVALYVTKAQEPKKRKRFGGFLKYMKREQPKERPEVTISMQDISSPKRTQDLQNLYDDIIEFWWSDPSQKITVESVKVKFTHVTDDNVIEEVFNKLHNEGLINKKLFVPRRQKFEYFWFLCYEFPSR